ncbi:hypothetical protein [Amycolatopsis magusensis]|uniref:hypothetical protein n=1 Tax=Amycolatopsis magusensis TaxID=882444 RepID=UPI0024A8C960|nr:hypothetical protein [Amycolatopsis magusensis]MDI5975666.1 hypothetical protein [Amycolatopsis magusensis]
MERNDQLRAAREAVPSPRVAGTAMSRQELADAVNSWLGVHSDRHGVVDEHYVARLERGKIRWPNADYRAAFAAVLHRSQAELGFRPSAANRRPVRCAPAPPLREPPAEEPPAEAEVVAIRAMASAFTSADRKVGGGLLYGQVVRYLNAEIGPRLLDVGGSVGSGLFAAASSVTEIAGWMAHDGGKDHAARRHFESAFRLASVADHDALAANVCASMSHLAGQLGESVDAVRIAEAGLERTACTTGTTRLTARLHAMRARGLAMRGDGRESVAALGNAERTLSSADGEGAAAWISGFDEASLAGEVALCLRRLGDLPGAQRHAERVIELRSGDRVRSRAFGKLTLARVLADSGRLEEAAVIGTELCRVATSLTSARVRARLDRLGDVLRPHAAVPEVAEFLTCLTATPVTTAEEGARWPV